MKRHNAVDLDGIIYFTAKILEECPDVATDLRERYIHMIVDEFQDTSENQYKIIRLINSLYLLVVGDIRQSIYGWRGAKPAIMEAMMIEEGVEVIDLEDNWRSTRQIVGLAKHILSTFIPGFDMDLTAHKDGPVPRIVRCEDELHEAQRIAATIRKNKYKNCAILGRTNKIVEFIYDELVRQKIPSILVNSGGDILDEYNVQMIFRYLSAAYNTAGWEQHRSIINWPSRRLNDLEKHEIEFECIRSGNSLLDTLRATGKAMDYVTVVDGLRTYMMETNLPSALFEKAIELLDLKGKYGEEKRTDKLQQLQIALSKIRRWERVERERFSQEPILSNFLDWLKSRWVDAQEKLLQAEEGGVVCSTIHGSKGLEWDAVFVAGIREGAFPSSRSSTMEQFHEEVHGLYVACTRAKTDLYATYPMICDYSKMAGPSVFAFEIEKYIKSLSEVKTDGG
jgi:DNA helicase-2/ATP-dependent DNA helicase PcrA